MLAQAADLNRMNVLHITGTKGKGSTSAFVSSILTTLAPKAKVGLYTSPHMVAVRERIRINGEPIAEDVFARYFWEVWDRLEQADKPVSAREEFFSRSFRTDAPSPGGGRSYARKARLLPLSDDHGHARLPLRTGASPLPSLLLQLTLCSQVDATILEVGVGGTYDSTNIVPQPITTGVTALGIDHIWVLGKTLPEIAAQKGGIYKVRSPFLLLSLKACVDCCETAWSTCAGDPAAGRTRCPGIPRERARRVVFHRRSRAPTAQGHQAGCVQLLVRTTAELTRYMGAGLAGSFQRSNASLAIALVQSFLSSSRCPPAFRSLAPASSAPSSTSSASLPSLPSSLIAPTPLPSALQKGLENARWPGRCQTESDPLLGGEKVKWFLDGAHTVESLRCCGEWFRDDALAPTSRCALFPLCEDPQDDADGRLRAAPKTPRRGS